MLPSRTPLIATLSFVLFIATLPLHSLGFSQKSQTGRASGWHADFNNDGREDFLAPATGGLTVQLSSGGGTYSAPKFYALPSGNSAIHFAIGQFCCAGDFIAIDGKTANYFVYSGKGDGTFSVTAKPAPNGDVPLSLTAGDFNHDGAMDIAYVAQNSSGQSHVQVLFGPLLSGDFSFGPTTLVPEFQPGLGLAVGDFDGDGKADLFSSSFGEQGSGNMYVYYGDNHGNFPTQELVNSEGGYLGRVFDLNGDGKSDVVVHAISFGSSQGDILTKQLAVYYGNAARTWSVTHIATNRFVTDDSNTAVADFNGDGIPDIVFTEASTDGGGAPRYLVIKTGKGAGAFNPEVTIATLTSKRFGLGLSLDTVRSVRNNKPNFAVTVCSTLECTSPSLTSFLNTTTSSGFPTCTAPSGFQGISVCAPLPGSTVSSPVRFRVGAVGQTRMRKVEVWIDGHKAGEQLQHAFSNYSFMDKSFVLSRGSHNVSVFAAGWDNWVEKKSFTLKVN